MMHGFVWTGIRNVSILLAAVLLAQPVTSIADETSAVSTKLERLTALTVYKTPTCGCCGKWVDHIEDAGFDVEVREMNNLSPIKNANGLPPTHQSCHTAVAKDGGYVFEGHIPARYITAFLADPPAGARGLVVPAMPVGSPGMEYQDRFSPYEVLLLKEDGSFDVYARVTGPEDSAGQH